ncbi:MAG: glycosyltransferase family 2 protein [Prevotellaceae bacterium]|jgi:glycosyltransferase involved in cell wall biosynthesis|nr:glycosyltransferase family 2 protein [Prevotellaceae bacterium]
MIEILLSIYNGEKYLEEQIQSIVNQTFIDWILNIRDDGSQDNSLKIIQHFSEKYPDKIFLKNDNFGNIGAAKSFYELLKNSTQDYIMFCDQDDVWLKNKIEFSIAQMQKKEHEQGKKTPLLFFTDLTVVDKNLQIISESFFDFSGIIFKETPNFNDIAVRNSVTGCTVLMNKSAVKCVLPITDKTEMHDIWCALCVVKKGYVFGNKQVTVLYRQHLQNTIGAKKKRQDYTLMHRFRSNKQRFECAKAIDKSFNIFKYLFYKISKK